ncbi:MAG TPA: hypothetical protein ENI23_09085 [bacterium]|nr:hypothetical protein [bacterium]
MAVTRTVAGSFNDYTNASENSGRQIVRSSVTNQIYVVTWDAITNNLGDVKMWKSSGAANFVEQDTSNNPDIASKEPKYCAAAIDSDDIIHIVVVWFDTSGMQEVHEVRHYTFNTVDAASNPDTWQVDEQIKEISLDAEPTGSNMGIDVAVDANDIPHVAYQELITNMGTAFQTLFYTNRIGGSWLTPVEIDGRSSSIRIERYEITFANNSSSVIVPQISANDRTNQTLKAYLGNALDASSFTIFTVESSQRSFMKPSIACSSDRSKTYITSVDINSDLRIHEHDNTSSWTTGWTSTTIDSTKNYLAVTGLAIKGDDDRYVFAADDDVDDLVLWYNRGAGYVETVIQSDGANQYDEPTVRWSTYVFNEPEFLDYVWEDVTNQDLLWNNFKVGELTHTTDSFLAVSGATVVTETHTTDSVLKKLDNILTHTTDSILKKLDNLLTHTTDSILKKIDIRTHTTDSVLKKLDNLITHDTDSVLKKLDNLLTHTTDSFLVMVVTLTHTTDSVLKKLDNTITHNTDSVLKKLDNLLTHDTDSVLKKLDNLLTHTTDSLLVAAATVVTETHTTDSVLKKLDNLLTHTTDSVLKKLDNLLTHTTDSVLIKRVELTHTTDSVLKKLDNLLTHTTDSVLKKLDNLRTHTTDSVLKQLDNTLTHNTDSVLKKLDNLVTHTTDSVLKRLDNLLTHTTDSFLFKIVILTHSTDSVLKKLDNLITHTTDSLLKKIDTRTHTTDSVLKKLDNSVSHTTDSFLATSKVASTVTAESVIRDTLIAESVINDTLITESVIRDIFVEESVLR